MCLKFSGPRRVRLPEGDHGRPRSFSPEKRHSAAGRSRRFLQTSPENRGRNGTLERRASLCTAANWLTRFGRRCNAKRSHSGLIVRHRPIRTAQNLLTTAHTDVTELNLVTNGHRLAVLSVSSWFVTLLSEYRDDDERTKHLTTIPGRSSSVQRSYSDQAFANRIKKRWTVGVKKKRVTYFKIILNYSLLTQDPGSGFIWAYLNLNLCCWTVMLGIIVGQNG